MIKYDRYLVFDGLSMIDTGNNKLSIILILLIISGL